jgi:hypothetical protein
VACKWAFKYADLDSTAHAACVLQRLKVEYSIFTLVSIPLYNVCGVVLLNCVIGTGFCSMGGDSRVCLLMWGTTKSLRQN